MRVSVFITCFNDTLFPQTGRAMVELLEREVDLDPHALEHGHRRAPGLGEQRVVEAGDEERRPHRRIMTDAPP